MKSARTSGGPWCSICNSTPSKQPQAWTIIERRDDGVVIRAHYHNGRWVRCDDEGICRPRVNAHVTVRPGGERE